MALADWNKRLICSRANWIRPLFARIPSFQDSLGKFRRKKMTTYPDAIANEKIRVKDRHYSLFSRSQVEFPCDAITHADLYHCQLWGCLRSNVFYFTKMESFFELGTTACVDAALLL